MIKFCIVSAIVVVSCHGGEGESTELWKRNDNIFKVMDILYDNLAHTVEDSSDKQKRSFSIMTAEIFRFILSRNGRNPDPVDLDQPADIMIAEYRSQMEVFKSVLSPAINAVKRACPLETSNKQCAKALAEEENEETKNCPEFSEHMKFRKATEELVNGEEYQKFLCEYIKESKKGDDKSAMDFVKDLEEGIKFKGILQKIDVWFQAYQNGNFPCNLPPLKENTSYGKPPAPEPTYSKNKKHKKVHHLKH